MKKSQITMFMVLGIVVVIIVALFIYASKFMRENKDVVEDTSRINADRIAIREYVQNCLSQVSSSIASELAKRGGSFNGSGIYWDNVNLNALAVYKTGVGYENNLLLKHDMENALSSAIKEDLKHCINLDVFRDKDYEISEEEKKVSVGINKDNLIVKLNYPLKFRLGSNAIDFDEFSARLDSSFGELYAAAIDILNEEIAFGYFDKEDFMLKHDKIIVEKHKPYPDIVYVMRKSDDKNGLVFQFAIKGKDTAGKEVLKFDNVYGCCTNKIDNTCFKNVNPIKCTGNYEKNINCECPKNLKTDAEGCCVRKEGDVDNCGLTNEKECKSSNGVFYKNDFRCAKANCNNWGCKSTYNYAKDDFSGQSKRHGESWCSYESIAGKGLDYVGTRHYLHSCIQGKEYIEECRDFREELCTEGYIGVYDKFYQKGLCRVNRWYDCALQNNQESCEDERYRDCYWADYLHTNLKCHPEVPPGFKFWEGNGKAICNYASFDKDEFGNEFPETWGHSALLYCQKSGDCGNKRNFADEITQFGYYNKDIVPKQWAYLDNGFTKRGDEFAVRTSLYFNALSDSASVERGSGGNYAVCDLWQAPLTGNCALCHNSKLYPCTEYRCKSLGKNCQFLSHNNSCVSGFIGNLTPPIVLLDEAKNDFKFTQRKSTSFNAKEYVVKETIQVHQPLSFVFETTKLTRCKLSLFPPTISQSAIENAAIPLPEILLNDYEYKTSYNVTLRFPSSNFTRLNSYNLFIRCSDRQGIKSQETIMKVNTKELVIDNIAPEILEVRAKNKIQKNANNDFSIFVNEPFNSCRYSFSDGSFANMNAINCTTKESDIIYNVNSPLGSYRCDANIFALENASRVYFACEDKNGNKNEVYKVDLV
ncbi:hypothetical protein HYX02_07210 [Candidatus Woesearchaeota archaeon]|nr:hypothetical protein [Candidatus Woesearchaeota archaeon]